MKTKQNPMDQPVGTFDRDALITPEMMDYADAWAMRFRFCGVPLEDLKQEAYYGLCQARTQFDPSQGVSFKTYATYAIRRFLCLAVEQYGCPMRIPKEEREAVQFLSIDRGRDDGEGDRMEFQLADSEGTGSWDLNSGWDLNESPASNGGLDFETSHPLWEERDDEEACREVEGVVEELLSILSPREQQVVELLCGLKGEPLSTSAVGKEIQVSPARVRQIFQVALKKMELQYNQHHNHNNNYNHNKFRA